ncbi:FtsW/RodA/SpoVE family cell cycle protein [Parvibacter caecicola]|uniref:FtsW/RodA/SpoVE family cell cycle protein n=1 Tax=Parvibacter caecicola TaxID=747645 RepID=UPI0023F1E6F0|nr:FtsW/RodA/SpoVE family cell cycle protein [Parvibacter caecicola]
MASRSDNSAQLQGPRILMLVCVAGLTLMGLVMVYSTSSIDAVAGGRNMFRDVGMQALYAVIGIGMGLIVWKALPYRLWATNFVWVVWAISVVLLVLTAVVGVDVNGAQRWLKIGIVQIQPSEFAKIGLLLTSIYIYYMYDSGAFDPKATALAFIVGVLVPLMFLFFTQSDLGTTAVLALAIVAVLWFGGVRASIVGGVLVALLVFAAFAILRSGYRSDRLVFLDPFNDGKDGLGNGYQMTRSYIAIVSGGLFGRGLGGSHEKFQYLFASDCDFIYSIIIEELGLVGGLVVLALVLGLLVSGLRIAESAPDGLGAMIAGSATIMLVGQAFLNMGSAIGALPTTGKPLPFVSSGGSSVMASFILVGLILSVSHGSRRASVYEQRRDSLRVVKSAPAPSRARRRR